MNDIKIRPAELSDLDQLARLFASLWPRSSASEHGDELRLLLGKKADSALTMPITILVAEASDGTLAGFVEVDLRSHADGCDPAQPVGYLEGWYVVERYRRCGVGKRLVAEAEEWAGRQNCVEMASDVVIGNDLSQIAHESLGYEVVDRCVHYRKML